MKTYYYCFGFIVKLYLVVKILDTTRCCVLTDLISVHICYWLMCRKSAVMVK